MAKELEKDCASMSTLPPAEGPHRLIPNDRTEYPRTLPCLRTVAEPALLIGPWAHEANVVSEGRLTGKLSHILYEARATLPIKV